MDGAESVVFQDNHRSGDMFLQPVLFGLTDPWAVRSAALRVAIVTWIIYAGFSVRAANPCDSSACLGLSLLALSLVLD